MGDVRKDEFGMDNIGHRGPCLVETYLVSKNPWQCVSPVNKRVLKVIINVPLPMHYKPTSLIFGCLFISNGF